MMQQPEQEMEEFTQLQQLIQKMKIRNSETNEEVLSINCGQVNQKQPVTSITEWSSITFDISNCDGQVVIIDKDNQDITEQLLKSKCKACVRVKEVNSGSHDDYHLWKFPVYIINQSHAAHLEALNKHSKLDVKMEDVYHQPPHEVQTQPKIRKRSPNPIPKMKKLEPVDLHVYLRNNWVKAITADNAHQILTVVISHFQHLEDESQAGAVYDLSDTTQHIFSSDLLSMSFPVMFSVYVFYLMCIANNPEKYICGDIPMYIELLISSFHNLFETKSDGLIARLEEIRKNLNSRWKVRLAESFLSLIDIWLSYHRSKIPNIFLLIAIPSINIAQTLLEDSSIALIGRNNCKKLWENHLLKYADQLDFSPQNSRIITSLSKGMNFQVVNNLSSCCYFAPKHLKNLVTSPGGKCIIFLVVKKILASLPSNLKHDWKTKFVSDFVEPLRLAYCDVLKKEDNSKFKKVSSCGDRCTTILEGTLIVIQMQKFVANNKCSESFDDSLMCWLEMLVKCVKFELIHEETDIICIDELFKEELNLSENQLEIVKSKLSRSLIKNLGKITPDDFLLIEKYTNSKGITDFKLLRLFFDKTNIVNYRRNDLICSESPYLRIIKKLYERNREEFVSEFIPFLERVHSYYLQNGKVSDLFLDLMKLNVCDVPDTPILISNMEDKRKFEDFLRTRMTPSISQDILSKLTTCMKTPARSCPNDFQLLTCNAVLEGIQNCACNMKDEWFKKVLFQIYTEFNHPERELLEDLNAPRLHFMCGITLHIFISKVNLESDSWTSKNQLIVSDILHVLLPLYVITEDVPPMCDKALSCIAFFNNVKMKIKEISSTLRDRSIPFNMLESFRQTDSCQELKSISCIIELQEAFEVEPFECIHEEFMKVLKNISSILFPFIEIGNEQYYDSLFRIMELYQFCRPDEMLFQEIKKTIINVEKINSVVLQESRNIENRESRKIDSFLLLKCYGSKNVVEVENLLKNLKSILGPLCYNLHIFSFFRNFNSTCFWHFVKARYAERLNKLNMEFTVSICAQTLSLACDDTMKFVDKAVEGNVSLNELGLRLTKETGEELGVFEFFIAKFVGYTDRLGHQGFLALLSLNKIREGVLMMQEVFSRCDLCHCMQHERFERLSNFAELLRIPLDVQLNVALNIKEEFSNGLPNSNGNFDIYFELFKEIKNAFEYINFLRSKGFVGNDGKRKFAKERTLMTQEIQHTLEQRMIDDLWDAYSTLIFFLDTDITYEEFKEGLQKLSDIEKCVQQIKTLKAHSITEIKRIFALREIESKESILKRLTSLFSNGIAHYSATDKDKPITFTVKYVRSSGESFEEWDIKTFLELATSVELLQINDQYIDGSKDRHSVIQFLKIYEICMVIIDIFRELRCTGHFKYQIVTFQCNFDSRKLEDKLENLKETLRCWQNDTVQWREKYSLLSFFSNWKINEMYELLCLNHDTIGAENLIKNSLLFVHCPNVDIMTDDVIQFVVDTLTNDGTSNIECPFSFVGCFIQKVWDMLPDGKKLKVVSNSLKDQSNFLRLYSLTNVSDLKLYNTAIYMLHLPMTSFQIMPCTTMTSQEAITLFFQRIKQFPLYRYILLEVNLLSSSIQEVVIKESYRLFEYGNKKQIAYDIVSIESKPSLLRTMPWCFQDNICLEESKSVNCHELFKTDRSLFTLVCGHAGNGKSHYIRSKMTELQCPSIVFSVNEGFSVYRCIQQLNKMAELKSDCSLHLNFTLPFLQVYAITAKEDHQFQMTCKSINWFFFSFFLSGYVEDYNSGISVSISQFTKLHVFVEIPVLHPSNDERDYLHTFFLHFPIFTYVISDSDVVFTSNETIKFDASTVDAKLVCKYLDARDNDKLDISYKDQTKFQKIFKHPDSKIVDGVKIDNLPDLPETKCCAVLKKIFTKHTIEDNKAYQRMFVRYMYRRCKFMEESSQMCFFNKAIPVYRDGIFIKTLEETNLRSSLLYLMEFEAAEMCITNQSHSRKGFHPPNIQLIYEEGSFSVLTRGGPAQITDDKMKIIERCGFEVPDLKKLKCQQDLESYLSKALNVNKIPSVLKTKGYVLTLDYLLKMIAIHERRQSGVPVILLGETGVGKTFLLETMCSLYNFSYEEKLKSYREKLQEFLRSDIKLNVAETIETTTSELESLNDQDRANIFEWFTQMNKNYNICSLFSLINFTSDESREISLQNCEKLVLKLLFGSKRQLFQTKKVHAGLTPDNIRKFLEPIVEEENDPKNIGQRPIVTIFFDEVNTSCCSGFLKEIIVDHSLDGKLLPENIFIVAACNPHRGNSVSTIHSNNNQNEKWFKGDYLVRPLHPSFQHLIWDFGFLEKSQEDAYIEAKLRQVDSDNSLTPQEWEILTSKIRNSQQYLRQFTSHYLKESGASEAMTDDASSSAVSQRDIQRVLKLYIWLKKSFFTFKKYGFTDSNSSLYNWHISVRALYTALAMVYYFRLSSKYRTDYAKLLDDNPTAVTVVECSCKKAIYITFSMALQDELNWLIENIELPPGVANIKALRENLYLIMVCCMTNTPLIITGPPGCSKTLSFKIAFANLQGEASPKEVFKQKMIKSLEPHIYQCSKHSVTDDIDALFKKATARQNQICEFGLPSTVVVFMDEVGLPDEKLQILKVLHHHLDESKVPFVALSNTTLDAAKSNRAICLFQTKTSHEDLQQLAVAMLRFESLQSTPDTIKEEIACLTKVFMEKMESEEFRRIFGLRDIMHFFSYIKRLSKNDELATNIPPKMIISSLQRNFSGTSNFHGLAEDFLSELGLQLNKIFPAGVVVSTLATLKDSLADKPKDLCYENEVRYKLLINHSEDETIVQLLFKFCVFERKHTRIYSLSKDQSDKLQKTTMVEKIKNSIANGHTIVLIQCDEIFENFYDLFNQRFIYIDDYKTKSRNYYARIASGTRSSNCLVHPNFQCVVLVKASEVQNTPAPFLNRFEKYPLSHESFLSEIMKKNNFQIMLLNEAKKKVEDFLLQIPPPGLYGFQDQTLESLLLAHVKMKNNSEIDCITISPGGDSVLIVLEKYFCSKTESSLIQSVENEIDKDIQYILSDIMKNQVSVGVELADTFSKLDVHTDCNANSLHLIQMVTQLICVRLVKKLLQLMPPEIFLAMKEKFPLYYVTSYLQHQFHFNLQELVKDRLNKSSKDSSKLQNKTLCFSRTSSFLFENLPHEYFALYSDKSSREKLETAFPKISENISQLCVLQVLPNNNTSDVTRKIKRFLSFDEYDVLLFLVNMQDISKDTVDHLRLVIEETEFQLKEFTGKQFIILLHFPGDNFFLHCYPAYFLDSWDICYLDSVAPTASQVAIDLKTCFHYAYGINNTDMEFMNKVVRSLLTFEFASRLLAHLGTVFPYIQSSRSTIVDLLLPENEHSIGKALTSKFCLQWSPIKMIQTLQQAANSALCLDYTLTMTDAISTIIVSNFFDFMYYILTLLTKHGVLFILLSSESSNLLNFIGCQIEKVELPTSSTQMKLLRAAIDQKTMQIPKHFPFFRIVYHAVEGVLKQDRHIVKEHVDRYAKKLEAKFKLQELLFITALYMDKDLALWSLYISEFLSLFYGDVKQDSVQFKYFHKHLQTCSNVYRKLIWLHCSFSFVPRNILGILSFFDTIGKNNSEIETERDVLELFSNSEQCAKEVITQFFDVLTYVANNVNTEDHFREKIDHLMLKYHEVFLSSPLKDLIYVTLPPEIEVKRDGIAVFFTLISTGYTFEIALKLLKHFTMTGFTDLLLYRIEYLMKLPVEVVTEKAFIMVLSPSCNDISAQMSSKIKEFVMKILKIVISYSSDQQKRVLIDWICQDMIAHHELQLIPSQNCTEKTVNIISSLCFINQFLRTIIYCDYEYFKSKVEKYFLGTQAAYKPYFVRDAISSHPIEHRDNKELLKSLLFLKEVQAKWKQSNEIGNLISQYNKLPQTIEADSLMTTVMKEVIKFFIVEETAKNIVNRSNILIDEVNNILTSDQTYGQFLVFRLLKHFKSFTKMKRVLLQENELCGEFSCLSTIRQAYQDQQGNSVFSSPSPNALFDFLKEPAKILFNNIAAAIKSMVDSPTQEVPHSLIDIAIRSGLATTRNQELSSKTMMIISLFLSIYHYIYMQEIRSLNISELLKEKIDIYLPPNSFDVMSIFITGETCNLHNRLVTSFLSPNSQTEEFKDMWGCVANLIASLLGTSENPSNFTVHLLQPNVLGGSYIAGSTTKGPVGKHNKKMYEAAMTLSGNGLCTNQQSFNYFTRGATSLPCLYFIQWANYACLCVHLLVYSSVPAKNPFNGELFEDPASAQLLCLESMERIWKLMIQNLNLLAEQRLMLINLCIGGLTEKFLGNKRFKGIFAKQEELDEYEKFINNEIFVPSWNTMLQLTETCEKQVQTANIDFQIIQMNKKYPIFADEMSFLIFVMSSTNLHNKHGPYYVLYQYLIKRSVLDTILKILPDAVDFYHWIHEKFSDHLTRVEVDAVTIQQLLENGSQCNVGLPNDEREYRFGQFSELCKSTETFQQISFGLFSDIPTLTTSKKLIEIISTPGASGSLLTWIGNLIDRYNHFLSDISATEYGRNNYYLQEIVKEYNEVTLIEACEKLESSTVSRFDDLSEILPLLEKCCCLSCTCLSNSFERDDSLLKSVVLQVYHLNQLQDDVTSEILSKFKCIKQASSLQMTFSFKNIEESVTAIFVESSAVSLDDLERNIPFEYKNEPNTEYIKQAMRHCHSLSYHSLLDITIGLRIAAEFIIQVKVTDLQENIKNVNLPDFLKKYVLKDETAITQKVLKQVLGVDVTRLNQLQSGFLDALLMKDIMRALHTFVMWLQDGMYDFSSFPLVLKDDLSHKYQKMLKRICSEANTKGEQHDLLEKIQIVTHSLSMCEKTVREIADPNSAEKSLKQLVSDYIKNGPNAKSFDMFPDVPVSQYVRYRLSLRKMHHEISKEFQEKNDGIFFGLNLKWDDKIAEEQLVKNLNLKIEESRAPPIIVKELRSLSCDEVANFIKQNGLGDEYADNAVESYVNGEQLLSMKNKPLRKLLEMKPVAFLQFKFMIMRAHNEREISPLAKRFDTKQTVEFCSRHDCLKEAIPFVVRYQMDGEMLLEADMDVLKEMLSAHVCQAAKEAIQTLPKL